MKKPQARKYHRHSVFIASSNHIFITGRTAWLENIFHTAFCSAVDAIAEREKRVGAKYHIVEPIQPGAAFLVTSLFRDMCEDVRPILLLGIGHVGLQELVNRVVAVGTLDPLLEGQS